MLSSCIPEYSQEHPLPECHMYSHPLYLALSGALGWNCSASPVGSRNFLRKE
uniref:Uncharacterized protein n=1 Tax=Anguilla anguilla TaxID=7936 RepID=A0A0E9QIZ9_ANGAN